MGEGFAKRLATLISVALCLYTLAAVNYSVLQPQSALAIFIGTGMVLCFLIFPLAIPLEGKAEFRGGKAAVDWLRSGKLRLPQTAAKVVRVVDYLLMLGTIVCFGYLFVQTEPWSFFEQFWHDNQSLGNRAGQETTTDFVIGVIGLLLVLEATRRSIGWIVPLLAIAFLLHAYFAASLPDWMLPHPGKSAEQLVSATFLQSLGVLGPAAGVMFKYVFLFVVFGAFLEMSGATQFIIDFAEQIFGRSRGGPAAVAVVGSGLMGSLSGSAVANAVTTGSFTIPMMENDGFKPHISGGITAAAASGGALVPPVMGAGAYMMLEFVERNPGQPQITFLEIARAAVIPALLYYFSLYMIVVFYSAKLGSKSAKPADARAGRSLWQFEGVVFFGALGMLVGLLILGFSAFKAVTGALILILVLSTVRQKLNLGFYPRVFALASFFAALVLHQMTIPLATAVADPSSPWYGKLPSWLLASSWFHPREGYLSWRLAFDSLLGSSIIGMFALLIFGLVHKVWRPEMIKAFTSAAKNGVALVAASACVGIIIGVVQTTPMANDFGEVIKGVVESSLLLALVGIMVCSLILGMGVPSVVCYLLMATLMGALLKEMGIDPLAAHLFIFYYGMMSMVTPPVALAAYASASIAKADIMPTAFAAFRFSLVGFTLPFMFIYRPALLWMNDNGTSLLTFSMINGAFTGDVPMAELTTAFGRLAAALITSFVGVIALATSVTGYFKNQVSWGARAMFLVSALLLLAPNVGGRTTGLIINLVGGGLFLLLAFLNWKFGRPATPNREL